MSNLLENVFAVTTVSLLFLVDVVQVQVDLKKKFNLTFNTNISFNSIQNMVYFFKLRLT
jgi:hypothetical protein